MKQGGHLGGSPSCGEEASLAAVIIKKGCWGCCQSVLGRTVFSTRECPLAHPPCSEISHACLRGWRGRGETLGLGAQEGPTEGKWEAWSCVDRGRAAGGGWYQQGVCSPKQSNGILARTALPPENRPGQHLGATEW